MKLLSHIALVIVLTFGMVACSKKKKSDQYAGIDGDYLLGTPLPDRVDGANFFGSNVTRNQFSHILFAFDSYSVSGAESYKVQEIANFMRKNSNDIILAGFTDSRGTEEYNRALGELRAQAVRQQLISSGINGSRIQTVSFGSEMPVDSSSSESAYAKNRRVEIGVLR
ncbi:MAG: OmpA family protein [Chthoniobacterales bacterium]